MDASLTVLEIEKGLKSLLSLGESKANLSPRDSGPRATWQGSAGEKQGMASACHEAIPSLTSHDAPQQCTHPAAIGGSVNGSRGSRKKRQKHKESKEALQKNGSLTPARPVAASQQPQRLTSAAVENSSKSKDGQEVTASATVASAPTKASTAGGAREQAEPGTSKNRAGNDRGGGNQIRQEKQPNADSKLHLTGGGTGSNVSTFDCDSWAAMLESNMILELKEKSKRFPNAKYLCYLCDYHMHEVEDVLRHKDLHTHKRKVKIARDDMLLERMPPPTKAHISALEEVLQSAYEANVLTSHGLIVRESIVSALRDTLTVKIPGLALRLYGSCTNGFAVASSDVNIALVLPESINRSDALDLIVEALLKNPSQYKFVSKNSTARIPSVTFLAETQAGRPDTTFALALTDSPKVCSLSRFLQECCRLDDRVRKLGVLLKHLCKMCRLDSAKESMLPSVAFSIMVVHFAQQVVPPLLPTFHSYLEKSEDVDLIPEDDIAQAAEAAARQWTVENKRSLAELWLAMLRFFALELDTKNSAVSASSSRPLLKSTMKWGGKKLAVQDPVCWRHNITHCVRNSAAFDYVEDCFIEAYRYFAVPQTKNGPAFRYLLPEPACVTADTNVDDSGSSASAAESHPTSVGPGTAEDADIPDDGLSTLLQSMAANTSDDSFAHRQLVANKTAANVDQCVGSQSPKPGSKKKSPRSSAAGQASASFEDHGYDRKKVERLSPSDMTFEFDGSLLVKGKPLPKFCSICHQVGHVSDDCDEACLPDIMPLPAFSPGLRKMLDKFLVQILSESEPKLRDYHERNDLLRVVQRCVEKEYPDAKLVLFGSSNNGFGFADSDLDICLTFNGKPTIGDMDTTTIIERLAKCLRRERDFGSILPIPTAKVPIVKFYSRMYQLEGDLSLYNTLAQRNTLLLRCYSEIDERVRLLGYGLKVFAKTCDIGDASRGSLSSYSYVLMVIYYLQQCEPPVLPVLQELQDGVPSGKDYVVDGWDTYFFDQMDKLPTVWPHRGENRKTAAELWIDMFRFYTEIFDVQNTVVCIRQHKKLTRLEKLWNGPTIAIEDPFDRDHNLGAALSVKMHTYIMSVLINGRYLYGTPPPKHVADDKLCDYFLQMDALVGDLVLPNDRGCRICHKIGHLARECPVKLQRKERDKKAKAKRQQQQQDDRRPNIAAVPSHGHPAAAAGGQQAAYFMIPSLTSVSYESAAAGSQLSALAPGGSNQAHRQLSGLLVAAATAGNAPVSPQQQHHHHHVSAAAPSTNSSSRGTTPSSMVADPSLPRYTSSSTGSSSSGMHTPAVSSSVIGHAHVNLSQPAAAAHPQLQYHAAGYGQTVPVYPHQQQQRPLLPTPQPKVLMHMPLQQQPVSPGEHHNAAPPPLYVQPPLPWMQPHLAPVHGGLQQHSTVAGHVQAPNMQEEQRLYLHLYQAQLQQQMACAVQQLSQATTQEQQQASYIHIHYLQQQLHIVSGWLRQATGTSSAQPQQHGAAAATAAVPHAAAPIAEHSSSRAAAPETGYLSSLRDALTAGLASTPAASVSSAGTVGGNAVVTTVATMPAVPERQVAVAMAATAATVASAASPVHGDGSHHVSMSRPISSPATVSSQTKSHQQQSRAAHSVGVSGPSQRHGGRTFTNSKQPRGAATTSDSNTPSSPRDEPTPSRKQ